jgi:hypothetical protein
VSKNGKHLRIPLLAKSRLGSVETRYWRKTLVTGPVGAKRGHLTLRVSRRDLRPGVRYLLRVRAVESGSMRTVYLRFKG